MRLLHNYRRTIRTKLRERSLIALTIVCLPCICVISTCVILSHCLSAFSTYQLPSTRRKHQREYEERERRRLTPWVLAPRLERDVDSLTICSDDESDREEEGKLEREEKKIHWQDQSPFFRLLPLEIRRQIYEECIGGYTLHISTLDAYRRMSHSRCKSSPSPGSCQCQCAYLARQRGVVDNWGNINLLALVGTCRRIYTEAIDVLYAKNTFTFSSIAPLISHLLNIPPQRIPAMRDVKWKMFIGSEEWNTERPWLDCRRKGDGKGKVAEEAGCACFECWPKEVGSDTRSHDWLRYCWLMRTFEQKKVSTGLTGDENIGSKSRCTLRR